MTELSTLGRAALYDHMVEALASHGTGHLNKKLLLESDKITDDDLRLMINLVCDVGDYEKPDTETQSRKRLVDKLADLLEHVSCMPGLVDSEVQPTLRSNNPESVDNPSLLQPQTERAHAIAQGQSGNVNRRVLHAARVAAGWKSHTAVGAGSVAGKKVLHQITDAYLQKQLASGLNEAEARKKMEREYIAVHETVARRPSTSYIARHQSPEDQNRNFMQHYIDLSPQAVEDFNQAMQKRVEEKSQNSEIYNIFKRYGLPYDHTLARTIVHEAWEKEVAHLTEGGAMLRGPAERKANQEYLNHHSKIMHLQLGKNLSPRAFNDIENVIIHASLDREKAGRA